MHTFFYLVQLMAAFKMSNISSVKLIQLDKAVQDVLFATVVCFHQYFVTVDFLLIVSIYIFIMGEGGGGGVGSQAEFFSAFYFIIGISVTVAYM